MPPDVARALVPSLRLDGLRVAGIYADAQTNDARLALANVRAAADAGAVVANYAEAVAIERAGGEWRVGVADLLTGTRLEVAASAPCSMRRGRGSTRSGGWPIQPREPP